MLPIQTVLITGASSGIGLALARVFASNEYNLVLVARNKDQLEKVAAELHQTSMIDVTVLAKDLSDPKAPDEIFQELEKKNITVDVLVNNAGFGTSGPFVHSEVKSELSEIQVNVTALTLLTRLFLPQMVQRKRGRILNVASTAAFQPGPFMAVYYATKAFVLFFSEALAEELEGKGVTVSCLCPGPTDTGFQGRAKVADLKLFQNVQLTAEFVARKAYEGLMRGKRIIIPGFKYKAGALAVRFLPRKLVTKYVRRIQEK